MVGGERPTGVRVSAGGYRTERQRRSQRQVHRRRCRRHRHRRRGRGRIAERSRSPATDPSAGSSDYPSEISLVALDQEAIPGGRECASPTLRRYATEDVHAPLRFAVHSSLPPGDNARNSSTRSKKATRGTSIALLTRPAMQPGTAQAGDVAPARITCSGAQDPPARQMATSQTCEGHTADDSRQGTS